MRWWRALITARVSLIRVFLALSLVCTGVVVGYGLSTVRAQGEDSTIFACVNQWNGATRIVDDASDCTRSDYVESWTRFGESGGLSGYEIVTDSQNIDFVTTSERSVMCPLGKVAISGSSLIEGTGLASPGNEPVFDNASPTLATGWKFHFASAFGPGSSGTVHLSVSCVDAPAEQG